MSTNAPTIMEAASIRAPMLLVPLFALVALDLFLKKGMCPEVQLDRFFFDWVFDSRICVWSIVLILFINSNRNGGKCVDVDECSQENGGCSQVCLNRPGNFSCECLTGYILAENAKDCIGKHFELMKYIIMTVIPCPFSKYLIFLTNVHQINSNSWISISSTWKCADRGYFIYPDF